MKNIARKFLLFYISAMLCAVPMAADAASKKTHKQVASSSKYKTSSRKFTQRIRYSKPVIDTYDGSSPPKLASAKALVINQQTGEVLYAKNPIFQHQLHLSLN